MAKKHLLIGCGSAALSAIEGIRSVSAEDEIKLVTRENLMPYSPTALPALLTGKITEENLYLRDDNFFQRMNATLVKNKKAVKVLPGEHKVLFDDGTDDVYDTLLIATGSHPIVPEIKGLEETGFMVFHNFDDYLKIKEQTLKDKIRVVIYGAGLVAVEMAIPLLEAGHKVDIVIRSRVLRAYFNPDIGGRIEEILMEHGAQIHKGCTIEEVKKSETGAEVVLSNGESLFSDVNVVCALGVNSATSLLDGSGVKVANGVIVDGRMNTSVEGIFAAGDVAETENFFTGELGVSAILPSAVHQGKIAGINMAGGDAKYNGWIPMNMFNFFGHIACSIGLTAADDVQVVTSRDDSKGEFKELCFKENNLVGATFLDVQVDPGIFLYLIEKKVDIGAYKDLLLEKPRDASRWLMLKTEKEEGLLTN
jgi:phenylglyoxylate dehydrogenase epsilon subunit